MHDAQERVRDFVAYLKENGRDDSITEQFLAIVAVVVYATDEEYNLLKDPNNPDWEIHERIVDRAVDDLNV